MYATSNLGAFFTPGEGFPNSAATPPASPLQTPVVPTPNPTQTATIGNNITSSPDIAKLSDLINSINRSSQKAANENRIPGAAGLEAASSSAIDSGMHGQLQPDVIRSIADAAATRGVTSGSPYGANTNADYLRAIGRTSNEQIDQAQKWLTAAYARNPAAPLYDPSSQLITPKEAEQFALTNKQLALQQYLGELAAQTSRMNNATHGGGGGGGFGGGGGGGYRPAGNNINWADLFGDGTANTGIPTPSVNEIDPWAGESWIYDEPTTPVDTSGGDWSLGDYYPEFEGI